MPFELHSCVHHSGTRPFQLTLPGNALVQASNVDCTGQCPGGCPAGQLCAARSGNFYTSSTQCACFCQTGGLGGRVPCSIAASISSVFHWVRRAG